MRLFTTDDLFTVANYNLDKWTNTFTMDFYLTYMTKWSDLFFAEEAPNGEVVGIGVGKVEGDLLPEKKDWRGHVSVLTIAPEYRRIGYSQRFMKYIEDVSELVDNAFFVDLFVRVDNALAVSLYKKLQYSVYRHILEYYGTGTDAYDMRRALPRDTTKSTIIPPYDKPIHVSKIVSTL
ncbi:N-acetyltransferase 5 [Blastocystis sp. ATCC 50177/Nand II]|uniref:N-acetyltransferase 5 n=1 Tax=Blastocystis sp. subtype 1 (strain ATCC 50177 / NandII) TaxID=478820 RepID=A0A196S7F5_BLAHN|nr:N-acetyltransferase 5 [Blastocystis sp. ATCC 50177/Nand II]